MDLVTSAALFVAAFLAGALNAVAGGGSFLTFPTLIFAGIPPLVANASSTVALFPGSFASVFAYRRELRQLTTVNVPAFFAISLVGGLLGALLLLWTPERLFGALVPWLLLFATVLFAFGKPISAWISARYTLGMGVLLVVQFVIAIYGGYFGGGIGILILASLGLFGLTDLNVMNGLKTLVAGALNAVATVTFIIAGAVDWHPVAIMLPAAVLGGYGGAAIARRIPQIWLRRFVLTVAVAITAYFFLKGV